MKNHKEQAEKRAKEFFKKDNNSFRDFTHYEMFEKGYLDAIEQEGVEQLKLDKCELVLARERIESDSKHIAKLREALECTQCALENPNSNQQFLINASKEAITMKDLVKALDTERKYNSMSLDDAVTAFEKHTNQKVPKEAIEYWPFLGLNQVDLFTSDFLNRYGLKNLLQYENQSQ